MKTTYWIVGIGIAVIGLIAFFILRGGSEQEVTTTTTTETSNDTNGLLGALTNVFGNAGSWFGGGKD